MKKRTGIDSILKERDRERGKYGKTLVVFDVKRST